MKIVIAPDSFKESLSALEVAEAIEAGFRQVFPEAHYVKVPVADGGEGTAKTLVDALGGVHRTVPVVAPIGAAVQASYGWMASAKLAVIEMAAASGLELVPPAQRDPRIATSYGTGELIRDALDAGASRLVIGIGGSATNDAGAGMLQALGVRLLDENGNDLERGGAALEKLARIDVSSLDRRVQDCQIDVACDVTNPLLGPEGASAVFGPQKGASLETVQQLERCLQQFARVVKEDLGRDVGGIPGTGAAGGLGAALLAVLNGRLRRGCDVVLEVVRLREHLAGADLVITGEGRTDGQTIYGKAPVGVARIASSCGVPVVDLAGSLTLDSAAVHQHGIDAVFSAVRRPCTLDEALQDAELNVQAAAYNVAAALRLGMRMGAVTSSRACRATSSAA